MLDTLLPGFSAAHDIHPMVVHFPIAFWVLGSGAWFVGLVRRQELTWTFGTWLQTLGLLSALVSIGFGYVATDRLGHDSPGHDLVHVHRDFMLWTTAVSALITAGAWALRDREGVWRVGLLGASFALLVMMTLGADRGALLVYRYGTGVSPEVLAPPATDHHGGDGHKGHAH